MWIGEAISSQFTDISPVDPELCNCNPFKPRVWPDMCRFAPKVVPTSLAMVTEVEFTNSVIVPEPVCPAYPLQQISLPKYGNLYFVPSLAPFL